ncbi:UNVERIFIED_CONTAM: sensor histidine kinase, partial [Bacteroidetes bacterium 56_B9]
VMAVHELATNASKYGALSVPEGRVTVSWDGASHEGVTLVWQESNGPRVEPPQRRGLGSRLIDRHPAFRAVSLEFPPDGARCSIALKPSEG